MSTRAILTYNAPDGHEEIQLFKTINEAKERIEFLRSLKVGYYNFKIKILKPY